MKKMKLFAALALTGLLAGCAGGPVADADDIAYLSADIRRDAALLTVDGVEVNAETYLFWLASSIESVQRYGGLTADEDWAESYGEEGTMSDLLKADALETTKLFQAVANKAAELGVTLTEEDQQALDDEMAQLAESAGSEENFRGQLEAVCISLESYRALNQVRYLSVGLQEKLEEMGELTVTDEELEAFVEENGIYAAKHILVSTRRLNEDGSGYEDLSDEEKAAALEKVNDLRRQLRDAGDSEEKFDALMNEYSEDGRTDDGALAAPEGYTYVYPQANRTSYSQMAMVTEFEEGAKALKVGEVSEPIETDYGYHIILRIPVDLDQARQECNSDYKFSQLTEQWTNEAVVETTAAYDALVPKDFYERLQDVVAARQEAREAKAAQESETPQESAQGGEDTPQESPAG